MSKHILVKTIKGKYYKPCQEFIFIELLLKYCLNQLLNFCLKLPSLGYQQLLSFGKKSNRVAYKKSVWKALNIRDEL